MGGTVVRVSDRSKNSLDRLLESMQRQADMAGKTGVERLVMQRDQLISRWQREQGAVDAITASYQKLIAAEMATGAGAGLKDIAAEARESKASLALMGEEIGVHIPRHIRGFISELPGVSSGLSAAFNAVAIVAVVTVIYEAIRKVIEFREQLRQIEDQPHKIEMAFHDLNGETQKVNDELRRENIHLENSIAKLEHKPQNLLAEALNDARINADDLAKSLDKDAESLAKVIKENSVGWMGRIVMGRQGTGDIEKWATEYQKKISDINYTGSGNVHSAANESDPKRAQDDAKKAQNAWNAALDTARNDALKQITGWIKQAETPQPAGKGTIFQQDDNPAERASRLAMLRGIATQLNNQGDLAALRTEHQGLTGRYDAMGKDSGNDLDAAMRAQRKELAGLGDDKFASLAAERQEAISDALDKYKEKAGPLVDLIKQVYDAKWVKEFNTESERTSKELATQAERWTHLMIEAGKYRDTMNEKSMAEATKALEERSKALGNLAKEHAKLNSTGASQALAHDKRMVQIGGASNDPLGILAQQQALDYVDIARRRQAALSNVSSDPAQAVLERANAEKAAANEVGQLRYAWEEKVAELQHQEIETLKRDSESLWNTLLAKPQEFGKQLGATLHAAVLKPITDGLSNITANVLKPVIYGADGQGGIAGLFKGAFGGKQDPMKMATDLNTTVTVQNSAALAALTAIMAGGMGMAVPAMATPAGLAGISLPSISGPAIAGGGAGGFSLPAVFGGGGSSGVASGGGSPLSMILGGSGNAATPPFIAGGSTSGPGGSGGSGVAGMLKNFKSIKWGGLTHGAPTYGTDAEGSDVQTGNGKITGVNGMAGAALFAGGMMSAQQGLLGSSRGTWGGIAMGTAGGAAIGFQQGGWLGAAIGGGAGLLIGLGEKLAGVESPENEAKRLVKQLYSLNIDSSMAKQIAGLAQQKYAGQVSVAVRDPEVRKMLMLYSEATGQKMPMSASTPYGGSLAEQNGRLYQQATFQNGTPYTFQSALPVLGNLGGNNYPNYAGNNYPGAPSSIVLNVNGQSAADLLEGRIANTVNPDYVQSQWASATAASNGRVQNAANLQVPGLVVS
ncbi:MAG: hypothetical protein ABSC23_15000 [Bryobacteraceae bacterium]